MRVNKHGVEVYTPEEIAAMVTELRQKATVTLMDCDGKMANVLYCAWKSAFETMEADIAHYFSTVDQNAKPTLAGDMNGLVSMIRVRINLVDGKIEHEELFHKVAEEWQLYSDDNDDGEMRAPIWLSRIVDGVLRDWHDGIVSD